MFGKHVVPGGSVAASSADYCHKTLHLSIKARAPLDAMHDTLSWRILSAAQ